MSHRFAFSRFTPRLAVALLGLAATLSHAQIHLAGVTETQGAGALAGTSFKNGYMLALEEVNASGGVLGQKLVLTQFDIDTKPEAALDAVTKAVATKPFAIMGPIFSGLTLAAMPATASSGIPHFTGGEAASLTRKFHPTLLRSSLSQAGSAPRLGSLATYGLGVKKIGMISVDNEFGHDGKAALQTVIKRRGATVDFDEAIKAGDKDYSGVVSRLKAANVEALLLNVNEAEAIELLKELRKQGFDKSIVADGLVAGQKVIDSVGAAGMEGVLVHMNASIDAPVPQMLAFANRYEKKYGTRPDQNGIKGYFVVQMLKAGVETAGKVDAPLFLKALRNTRFDNKNHPELLSPISYDLFGDLNRESYFAVVRDGRPRIFASIRAADGGFVEVAGGRQIALNSNEFRAELAAARKK